MSKQTLVLRPDPDKPGEFIWLDISEIRAGPPPKRAFNIISDFSEPVQSTISGERFSSRAGYLRHVKDNGCEVVGNDFNNIPQENTPRSDDGGLRDDIDRSIGELES